MRLLILGGTHFLGRALTDAAVAAGHDATLFHRGRTYADDFPHVRHILGDRDGGLGALGATETWDAVIDTCGFVPRLVRDAAECLRERIGLYTFVSSVSVYADPLPLGATEDAPRAVLDDPTVEEVTYATYGGLKTACEDAALDAMGGRALWLRPGLIVGPYDVSDRFPYWPRRVARGGRVLAPGRPERGSQFIDVRDLAAFTLRVTEQGAPGAYHATGEAVPFGTLLDTCRATLGGDATFEWVDEAFLLEREVAPYTELPLWLPESEAAHDAIDCSRARAAGLRCRPLAETVRDTFAWDQAHPIESRPRKAGATLSPSLTAVREAALLAEWDAR